MNAFAALLRRVLEGEDLSQSQAAEFVGDVMDGTCTPVQAAALLAALAQAAPHIPPAVSAIHAGRQKYTHIPIPILAIYALPPAPGDRPIGTEAQANAFEAGVPSARVVRLPHARHEVFSSNEEDVLREMNAFIAGLP